MCVCVCVCVCVCACVCVTDRLALREREGRGGVDFDELDEQRSDVGRVDAEPRDPPVVAQHHLSPHNSVN